jgi:hypothetical protein
MSEHDRVTTFVEDVLARARIPSRSAREELRRELLTHFDDAVRAGGSLDAAFAEFGLADDVAARFCVMYRAQRLLAHAVRIAAGLTVSLVVALGIELVVSRPGAFRNMAGVATMIVLVLVLWRELVGRRLPRPTAAARAGRWVAAFLAFVTWQYGIHHYAGISLSMLRAAASGGVLVTVAASTAIILAGADRAFGTLVHRHEV